MKKKKKENPLMREAKNTIGLGILSVPTVYGFARVGSNHPATAQTAGAVVSGMNLLNVGQLAKTGLTLAETVSGERPKMKPRTKNEEKIRRMLG